MPETFVRSEMDLKGPFSSRYFTIAAALLGPMPGMEVNVVASAVFMFTVVPKAELPEVTDELPMTILELADVFSPSSGTDIFIPSLIGEARFKTLLSASGRMPPAASMASYILEPRGNSYTPGRTTAPLTCIIIEGMGVGDVDSKAVGTFDAEASERGAGEA